MKRCQIQEPLVDKRYKVRRTLVRDNVVQQDVCQVSVDCDYSSTHLSIIGINDRITSAGNHPFNPTSNMQ